MKKTAFIGILVFVVFSGCLMGEIVTRSDGQAVKLNEDFTWEYVETAEGIIDLVGVEGGSFQRVSGLNNQSISTITVSSFSIGRTEVTQSQWQAVMTDNPSQNAGNPDSPNYPVETISWYQTLVFCNRLSLMEGLTPVYRMDDQVDPDLWGPVPTARDARWDGIAADWDADGYRLPTEAEWEFAARGGVNSLGFSYSGSDDVSEAGWYGNNSRSTQPVGLKLPNELGLYDMSGNVYEWIWDLRYSNNRFPVRDDIDPKGAATGTSRALRGGGYHSHSGTQKVDSFTSAPPFSTAPHRGFRVVRN